MVPRFHVCLLLVLTGCSQTWAPPVQQSPIPSPTIYVRSGDRWIPMSPRQAEEFNGPADFIGPPLPMNGPRGFSAESSPQFGVSNPRPVRLGDASSTVLPQPYYVRPEWTSTGYTPGAYGRLDNYTPGYHTTNGYVPGHYRADGNYTRPEWTSTGYTPGHYRAEPLPTNYVPPPIITTPPPPPPPGWPRP